VTVHADDAVDRASTQAGAGAGPEAGVPALMERIEDAQSFDATIEALRELLPDWVVTGRGRELLGGRWLGHSLHPLLTDLPLGCWSSASLLDLLGGHLTTSRSVTRDNRLLDAPVAGP
jgi:hypothetical protein